MISSDYVRVFLTIVDKGSFSAASEVLNRSQTAISYSVKSLEAQLGVQLFDRTGRRPVLTPAGIALIPEAQKIVHGVMNLHARADAIAKGVETDLSIAIDAYFPPAALATAMRELAEKFPETHVTLVAAAIGTALALVADGKAALGIVSHATSQRPDFQQIPLEMQPIHIYAVAAAEHPLADVATELTAQQLSQHIQIVTVLNLPFPVAVISPRLWHCTDLATQRQMVLAGIGWSVLPHHIIADDLRSGALRLLPTVSWSQATVNDIAMNIIHRNDALLGPAARWLIARLSRSDQALTAGLQGPTQQHLAV